MCLAPPSADSPGTVSHCPGRGDGPPILAKKARSSRGTSSALNRCVDWVLVVGIGLVAGGVAVVAPWEVVLVAGVTMWLATRDGPRGRRGSGWSVVVLAALAVGVGWFRAEWQIDRYEAHRAEALLALPAPVRCAFRAHVESSPVRVRDAMRWDASVEGLLCDGRAVEWLGTATLFGGPPDLARGDALDVVAQLGTPQRLWNEATGDPRPSEARRGVLKSGGVVDARYVRRARGLLAWIDRVRARVRVRIDATFPEETAGMARALVLGESDLAPGDDDAFRASGLSHLLAVSGMHLVLVVVSSVALVRALLVRWARLATAMDVARAAAFAGLPVTWIYAELAGAGGSTIRAAWMLSAGLTAMALGRRGDGPRAFALSLVAMSAQDPLVAFDLSFLLSAAATAGLLLFARPMGEWFAERVPGRFGRVATSAATTVAATIPCAPILARFAPTLPVGGVIANLLAVPVGESIALPLCLAHSLLAPFPAAERGCAIVASGALVVVRFVARVFASPSLAVAIPVPTGFQLALSAIGLVVLAYPLRRWSRFAVILALGSLLELGACRAGTPHGALRATFLDVGQGDAALVDLPDGEAILIDGGGLVGSPLDTGLRVVAPALRARRKSELALAVLTHPHPDHFTGLATGLDGVRVGALWDTGQGEREGVEGPYAALLRHARARGIRVQRPAELCGAHDLGGALVEVLAPCPDPSPDRNPNDNSFVLRISNGRRAFLFVGDAEHEEEAELLARAPDHLRADVLKVGHHGSRTSSSPEFIRAVRPREAVISVGARNRFGHPSPQTIATLEAFGARVWRTDRDGAVVVTTDGERLDVSSMHVRPGASSDVLSGAP
jgi:competence protein ComEC